MSEKIVSQRARILTLLRERGAAGATNIELNQICFRYGGRIFELRKLGFGIRTIREGESIFRFVLHGEPERVSQPAAFSSRRFGLPLFDLAARS